MNPARGNGVKVVGIDPGSLVTGYGVIEVSGSSVRALEYSVIRTNPRDSLERRLAQIYNGLVEMLERCGPRIMAVEEVFYRKNFRSAVMIGEARGIAMLAAANCGIAVESYPPARIKQAVVGNGRAVKGQVNSMVSRILSLPAAPEEDAADALAAALCHSHTLSSRRVQLR